MFGPNAVLPDKATVYEPEPEKTKPRLVAELPASARAVVMRLALGNASLTVPHAGAGAFHALADLRLSHARIEPGTPSEANLGRLLSASCCPRLRRARLEHVLGLAALRIESAAATLEELSLDRLPDMTSLELLDAPGLRTLRVVSCGRMLLREASAAIHAPKLEHLACGAMCHPDRLEFTGLDTVRRLKNIHLWSHLHERRRNAWALWLLSHCTAMDSLSLRIAPPMALCAMAAEDTMSLVPPLPNVTSLEINVHASCGEFSHRLASSVARFVARCSGLRRLSVAFSASDREPCSDPGCFCRVGEDEEAAMEMSLEGLKEVRIAGFCPQLDHHVGLVRLLVASAPALEKMTPGV